MDRYQQFQHYHRELNGELIKKGAELMTFCDTTNWYQNGWPEKRDVERTRWLKNAYKFLLRYLLKGADVRTVNDQRSVIYVIKCLCNIAHWYDFTNQDQESVKRRMLEIFPNLTGPTGLPIMIAVIKNIKSLDP